MVAISFEYDQRKELSNAINKTLEHVQDLTIPYTLIAQSWFKSNKSMFYGNISGPRKYVDLTDSYKKQKQKKYGRVYPVLFATGKLKESITNPAHSDSINRIVNKKELILGTKVTNKKGDPYAFFLQNGTRNMPARPAVLFGVEQVATSIQNQRLKAWINILEHFLLEKFNQNGGPVGTL